MICLLYSNTIDEVRKQVLINREKLLVKTAFTWVTFNSMWTGKSETIPHDI